MGDTIYFYDVFTEEGQIWVTDENGVPTEPERPTDKPFYIYKIRDRYYGMSKDSYGSIKAVCEGVFDNKRREYAKKEKRR